MTGATWQIAKYSKQLPRGTSRWQACFPIHRGHWRRHLLIRHIQRPRARHGFVLPSPISDVASSHKDSWYMHTICMDYIGAQTKYLLLFTRKWALKWWQGQLELCPIRMWAQVFVCLGMCVCVRMFLCVHVCLGVVFSSLVCCIYTWTPWYWVKWRYADMNQQAFTHVRTKCMHGHIGTRTIIHT